MSIVFERVELDYGRHGGTFRLVPYDPIDPAYRVDASAGKAGNGSGNGKNGSGTGANGSDRETSSDVPGRPFVILGPNGAGKTTLMEAPVRALFGFKRNRKEGREAHGQRKPWVGGPYRALVVVRTPSGRYTFERDFETDRIRVTEDGRQSPTFDAEANPSRTGESVRQYREVLRTIIGLDSFDHYRDTACVFQGGLLTTGLSVELLRVAAGGHTDVESAHARLRKEYASVTVEPIAEGVSRRRKPGALERLRGEIEELEAEATEARAAEERRIPLVRSREEAVARLDALADEIERLEVAFETLSEGHRLETEVEATRARMRGLASAEHELDEALAGFNLLIAREEAYAARYPADFAERARALEEGLWPRLSSVDEEIERLDGGDAGESAPAEAIGGVPAHVVMLVAGGLGAAGVLVAAAVSVGVGVAVVIGATALGAFAYTRQRAARDRVAFRDARVAELRDERTEIARRVERLVADVPDGATLRPDTISSARREYEREEADRRLHADGERSLRQAMDAAARAIALHRSEPEAAPPGDEVHAGGDAERAHRETDGLPDRARARLRELRDAIATERDEHMAPLRLRLNEIARARFDLPGEVEPHLETVRLARRDRLKRAGEAQAELSSIERALASEGSVIASALSLERELAGKREQAEALEARAAAYRHAYSFVADAYEAFRTTDEDRLLGAISSHLEAVSGGALGPIEADGGLDEATIRAADRSLPLTSPPLSYGQLHAALLSVRMGAADFLAGLGVGLPLLIDDPFVHLDERSVADLWAVLERIATKRQVIVATQDRLVLDHLGVPADLEMSRPPLEVDGEPPPLVVGGTDSGSVEEAPPENRVEDGVLDLWNDSES